MEEKKEYPQVNGNKYPIDKMSIGYLKTQLEKIKRTEINSNYKSEIEKEYNKKKPPVPKKKRTSKIKILTVKFLKKND
jgi:hypothetical protein